jgi:hypothetical protein
MPGLDPRRGDQVPDPADGVTRPAYEAPRLDDLGTVAELTAGSNPTSTDGVNPGSVL